MMARGQEEVRKELCIAEGLFWGWWVMGIWKLQMDSSWVCSGNQNWFVLVGREWQLFLRMSPLCVMRLMSIFIS